VAGREAQGIVAKSEVQALKEELTGKLNGLRDEEKNAVAIEQIYNSAVVNAGPYVGNGPDLIVGYGEGYRVSWDAAQGKVAGSIIEDNTRRWSGDHCLDPAIVPGCLFSNWRLKVAAPRIMDIAPTVLSLFGVKPPAYMQGRSLLAEEEQGSSDHV
jgi:predicted AlkP superfamily phosphohydrolase/phosphomutase